MKKINRKITFSILCCSIIMTLLVSITCIFKGIYALKSETEARLIQQAENKSQEVDLNLRVVKNTVNTTESIVESTIDVNKLSDDSYMNNYIQLISEAIEGIVDKSIKNNEAVSGYVIFDPKLTKGLYYVIYQKSKSGKLESIKPYTINNFNENNKDLAYFFEAIKSKNSFWTEPTLNKNLNMEVMSSLEPLKINDKVIGIVGMDLEFSNLKKLVTDMKIYDTGYAFLLNKNFNYDVHKTLTPKDNFKTVDNGAFKTIGDEMEKTKSGFFPLTYKGIDKFISYSKLSSDHILVFTVPRAEVYKEIFNLIFIASIVTLFGIIACILVSLYLGKKISTPILYVTEELNKVAKMDLRETELNKNLSISKDEAGEMVLSLIKLKKELRTILENVKTNSTDIYNCSIEISDATSSAVSSMEEVSSSVVQLSSGAEEQSRNSSMGCNLLENLSKEITTSVNNSNLVKEYSSKCKEINNSCMGAVEKLIYKNSISNTAAKDAAKNAVILYEKSNSITEIVTVIKAIAEQTNLLALNAAIEAARAGEAGKGFAVVAEEIRKLSDQTTKSIAEINSIIDELQISIDKVKSNIDSGQRSSEEATEAVYETEKALKAINAVVDGTIDKIDILIVTISSVNTNKDTVLKSIKDSAEISEESATSIKNVASSIEIQSNSFNNISQMTNKLKNISNKLHDDVNKFNI